MEMTKRDMFMFIKNAMADDDMVTTFCDHEIALLDRKSNRTRKPTKTQLENEVLKDELFKALSAMTEALTIQRMTELIEILHGLTGQKISSLITSLRKEGKVVKTTYKRVNYYKVNPDYSADEDDEDMTE